MQNSARKPKGKKLEAQSELLEQQEIKEEAEEVFKNQIFSSKLFQQRSLSIYTVAFMLEASIQVARRSNSGGNTILTGKGATVSRMSLKPSDTVSEASQMRKNLTMKVFAQFLSTCQHQVIFCGQESKNKMRRGRYTAMPLQEVIS